MSKQIHGLYVITNSALGSKLNQAVEQALRGGARIVQYRAKQTSWRIRLQQARSIRLLCRHYRAYLIINDDVELALAVQADGVHLGKDDIGVHEARERLGASALIGVSCYNQLARAQQAQKQGADYVAFGRFFPSKTKPDACQAPIELLGLARQRIHLPIVAIGGITYLNAKVLIDAGADALAVIDAVFAVNDVYSASMNFQSLFNHRFKYQLQEGS